MEIDIPFLWLVPFRVEQEIFGVTELLDLFGVKLFTVGYCECVVVRHLILIDPVCNFIFIGIFNISTKTAIVAEPKIWTSPLLTALLKIQLPSACRRKAF